MHLIAFMGKHLREHLPNLFLIIYNQYPLQWHPSGHVGLESAGTSISSTTAGSVVPGLSVMSSHPGQPGYKGMKAAAINHGQGRAFIYISGQNDICFLSLVYITFWK
jgi:hypothetical protein